MLHLLLRKKKKRDKKNKDKKETEARLIMSSNNNNMNMVLRFDRASYAFTTDHSSNNINNNVHSLLLLLNEVIGGNHGYNNPHRGGFNDLGFYLDLCAKDGCTKVDLSSIHVHHSNEFCMGIKVFYQSTFRDGSTSISFTPDHVYEMGYYAYSGGRRRVSSIIFADGEYLAEIRTRQGEITDQITFITNRRSVSFGGNGGDGEEDTSRLVDLSRRIVAFVGTANGVLERLGAISISRNWEEVGHFVILRALIEQNRATLQNSSLSEGDAAVQTLVVDMSGDVFKRVLSFLGYGMKVSD